MRHVFQKRGRWAVELRTTIFKYLVVLKEYYSTFERSFLSHAEHLHIIYCLVIINLPKQVHSLCWNLVSLTQTFILIFCIFSSVMKSHITTQLRKIIRSAMSLYTLSYQDFKATTATSATFCCHFPVLDQTNS